MRKPIAAVALALFAGITAAQAQNFPTRPITLIAPFPPGGSTDTAARILGERPVDQFFDDEGIDHGKAQCIRNRYNARFSTPARGPR